MSLATLFDFFFLTIKKKSKKKLAQNRHSVTNKIEIQKEINLSTEKRTSGRCDVTETRIQLKRFHEILLAEELLTSDISSCHFTGSKSRSGIAKNPSAGMTYSATFFTRLG